MRANKSRDSRPERAVRSAVHRRGLRFWVDRAPLAGIRRRADLVFSKARVAVYVDGCYWHGCPEHYRPARRNAEFWAEKVSGNQLRDADTDAQMASAGWLVLRVWEHDDAEAAADAVEHAVRTRRGGQSVR
jgi:DNA mismatch endonuclease (patch repair protein)